MNNNQIEVRVIANGQSKSVVLDLPPPALGVKFYDTADFCSGNATTATTATTASEIQQLREQVRTFDSANLWQANRIKELELTVDRLANDHADACQREAETRVRCEKLEKEAAVSRQHFDTPSTAREVQHLKERVRTLDSANLWQSSNLNRLEKEAAVSRQQLAETRDRCNALETRVHDLDSALVHSRSENETLRNKVANLKDQLTKFTYAI